jgi:hypothetical protein
MEKLNQSYCRVTGVMLLGIIALVTNSFGQTDITNSGGTITAQYNNSNTAENYPKVIDNNVNTKYYVGGQTAVWIQYQNPTSAVITKYSVTSANDFATRDPKNWSLQGSANGSTWVTLNTQSNQTFTARFQKKEYTFTNSTAYVYYRLNITANNGATATQLAEWELWTSAPVTNVATVYQHCTYGGYAIGLPVGVYSLADLQSRGITNNDLSSLKVTSGYKVTMFDTDYFLGASLSKTGDDDCLVNESFNDKTTSLKVEAVSGDWTNFQYPTINFQDQAQGTQGSTIFHNAIPDPVADMRAQILDVVKKIYYNANDNILAFNKLNFYLQDFDGVAYKSGSPPEITIVVSVRHIQNVYNNAGGNNAAVRNEILGILSHEGTHGYQYEPKNAGTYTPGTEFYGFIEGLADYVRIAVGLHADRRPATGGSWTSGYTTSGFFIYWMATYKDPNFAIKFNHAARTYTTWSWNLACTNILGESVQSLWNQYQAWIPSSPAGRVRTNTLASAMEQYNCITDFENRATAGQKKLSVFPNPAASILNLKLLQDNQAQVNEMTRDIEIINVNGGIVKKKSVSGLSGEIEVRDLPSGWYILLVKEKNGSVLKERFFVPDRQ